MNPYQNLPAKAFWKLAVNNKDTSSIVDLWDPKFNLKQHHAISTYGSCFSQHIGPALLSYGFNWLNCEPAPKNLSKKNAKLFNYDIFSSRTGNIYTASMLLQWTRWALNKEALPEEYWQEENRLYDPFRPRIEPNGFCSLNELRQAQNQTLKAFRDSITNSDFFIFTMGQTECWSNKDQEYEYHLCPGTASGHFDKNQHQFSNQTFQEILENLSTAMLLMREINPHLKFILTVSPIPMAATCSSRHVLTATMATKSILRAVADQLATQLHYVDYFPSYEMINSPIFEGRFFNDNQRTVTIKGVSFVIENFINNLSAKYGEIKKIDVLQQVIDLSDPNCEEELLEAFSK